APPRAYSRPFTRFSLPCDVDGQGAWDAELDITKERDFLVTSKSRVDFRIGEIRIDLTMLEEMKDIDVMLDALEEVEALDRKYKELEESKPILDVLENYMTYPKNFDEVLMGRARQNSNNYSEEVKIRIVEHGLAKKMYDPGNFVLPVKVNGTIEMNALADTGASVSVLPYCLFMNLGLRGPLPYNSNLTMADNTQAKATREVKNTWGTLCIDDGVIRHTYFPKPRAKAYLDNFAQEEEDDWLSYFKVRRDKDGNPKYGPVAPSFLDIEDDMERALAMEA
nr:hypothetical protein [Tanacetum cinerariifolium]